MAIPRLAATSPISVTVNVSAKLRPYFTQWFQENKKAGQTPEQFVLELMKKSAAQYYNSLHIETEFAAAEVVAQEAKAAVLTDSRALYAEMDD